MMYEWLSFSDPGTRVVTLGTVLIGIISAVIGCFTFLQKRALIGDTISHSVLPGICFAFILSGTKDPYILLLGAAVSGWLSVIVADWITNYSKIKKDTSIAIVLSMFFAAGMMLLTIIQHSGNVNKAGLHHFLFGKAAAIVMEDVVMLLIVGTISLAVVISCFNTFKLYIFDPEFAGSLGLPVKWIDFLLTSLAVLAIALGIRVVGVVLMSALLIAPAAAARYWTSSLAKMVIVAMLIGAVSGFVGAAISYFAPAMPTGPWIIIVVSLVAFASILTGSEKGVMHSMLKLRRFRNKVLRENILKIFYHLAETGGKTSDARNVQDLLERRPMPGKDIKRGLKQLAVIGLVEKEGKQHWKLTTAGREESQRIVRMHRLWEVYLTEYMNIAADHVHDDADAIEHILTPSMQRKLEAILEGKKLDPHDKPIPE